MTDGRHSHGLATIRDDQGNTAGVEVIHTLDSRIIRLRLHDPACDYHPVPGRVDTLSIGGHPRRVTVLHRLASSPPGTITFSVAPFTLGQ